MNEVVIIIYVRIDGWMILFEKNMIWDIFSNIGIQCRFVIKRGHIFSIPIRVKFIHLISLPKCKHFGCYEN